MQASVRICAMTRAERATLDEVTSQLTAVALYLMRRSNVFEGRQCSRSFTTLARLPCRSGKDSARDLALNGLSSIDEPDMKGSVVLIS